MVKKIFLLVAVSALVVSCDQKKTEKVEELKDSTAVLEDTLASKSDSIIDNHTAQTSLDVDGTYKGIIPCADCEGIEITLRLEKGNTYVLSSKYLGKGDGKPVESKGNYTWSKDGNKISLGEGNNKTLFKIEENQIVQLDQEGNIITGELASKYILKKEK